MVIRGNPQQNPSIVTNQAITPQIPESPAADEKTGSAAAGKKALAA
jgi:hypothetical protein